VAALLLAISANAALPDVHLPVYTRQVLPNGIVLDVIPRREVPLVTVRVLIRGGVESEPPGLSGLAAITAEAMRRGTPTRTSDAFSRELDALGANLFTFATMQTTVTTLELLSKDFDKGLDLLLDVPTRPTFPQSEIEKLLAQRIDAARSLKDNPGAATVEYYRNFFFGPRHPYGRPADQVTLAAITRQAISDYHRSMYVGRNLIVIVAGDVDPEKTNDALARAFGKVPAGAGYTWKQATLPQFEKPRLAIIDKPDATETQFRIGMPGIDRRSPDRVPLWIVNTLFGGRFTSVLNDALRVESGLTYGAGSVYDQDHLQGRLTISSYTATANTVKAIDMALEVMKKIVKDGITPEQLASAKAYLKGTYPSDHLETSDQLAEVVGDIEVFDLNRGEVDDLFSRIDALTLEQANSTARRYLKPENLTFLLLGSRANMPAEVAKYSPVLIQQKISEPGLRVIR